MKNNDYSIEIYICFQNLYLIQCNTTFEQISGEVPESRTFYTFGIFHNTECKVLDLKKFLKVLENQENSWGKIWPISKLNKNAFPTNIEKYFSKKLSKMQKWIAETFINLTSQHSVHILLIIMYETY